MKARFKLSCKIVQNFQKVKKKKNGKMYLVFEYNIFIHLYKEDINDALRITLFLKF